MIDVNDAMQTRVLVTHGIQFLPEVDEVIVVRDGKITESGPYEALLTYDGEIDAYDVNDAM